MSISRHEHFSEVGKLASVAIAGQSVTVAINLTLTRHLSVDAYEAYVIAAALFLLLLAVAAQGLDKYALRVLPAKLESREWSLAANFFRYAASRLLVAAILIAVLAALWARDFRQYPPETLQAVYIGVLALPAGVFTYFLCSVLSATGDCVKAAAVTLLIVPLLTLLFIALTLLASFEPSGAMGIGCWTLAWCFGLGLSAYWVWKAWPAHRGKSGQVKEPLSWRREALPFWLYRLVMGAIAQVPVLMLDWLQPSAAAVGAYAVAISSATLASVLAVSTNRVYARELSILMEIGDYAAVSRLRLERLQWLLPALALFLALALGFTREILGLFNTEFVSEGVAAFRLLAITTSATVVLGIAPTYLKYRKQYRLIFSTLGSCALLQILLLIWLVPRLEATGAAIAYMVSMLSLFGFLATTALQQLRRQRRETDRYSGGK